MALAACTARPISYEDAFARQGQMDTRELTSLLKNGRKMMTPIEFDTDSDRIRQSSYPFLNKVAEILKDNPHLKLIIEGHTDNTGPEEWNMNLSNLRAGAVKEYLAVKGVHPDSMRVKGFGSSVPLYKGKTTDARQRNRRVIFYTIRRDWKSIF